MPKVSVLVAVYNAERYLDECIRSLLSQTLSDIEVVCIDDASTDLSLKMLEQYAAEDGRIVVVHNNENVGQACSRNIGIRLCHGEYICFLDSDDWFDADSLEKAIRPMEENTDVWCSVFRLIKHFEADGSEVEYPSPMIDDEGSILPAISGKEAMGLSIDWSLHGVYVARAELFHEYPYDTTTRYYSDDNTTRIHYLHSPLVAQSEGIYHYRRHAEAGTMKVSMRSFDHILANHSMRVMLAKEDVPRKYKRHLELCSWYNFIGACRIFHFHKDDFSADQQREIRWRLRYILHTFSFFRLPVSVTFRFGYIPIQWYWLFMFQQWTFWNLRTKLHKE